MSGRSFGRYKVTEEVGRGAMGVVYRGLDPMIGRPVAIKAINVSYLDSVGVRTEEYLERFQREAQVAGRLSHPGIVKIYDLGPNYLVMEFVEGQSLASLLRARHKWALSRILQMVGEVAEALDYAHSQGIVHRDVKPANIMVQPSGSVKVMDFGLARIESSTLTAAGEILGSASYMAPEVVLGRTATPRSDIFSLAVVVYELMTGDRPFAGASVSAIIHRIVKESPRATGELALNLPPAYDAIFARALAKEPAHRYVTAAELAGALAAAQWADRDPLLPDPKEVQRRDPGATLPPVPKQPPASAEEPTVLRAQAGELAAPDDGGAATMLTVDAAEVGAPGPRAGTPAEESPLAKLVSDPADDARTLRAMPPLKLPEDAMEDKKDEKPSETPATVILKPGSTEKPKAPEQPETPPASETPATVIMKPAEPKAPTPTPEKTVIVTPPAAPPPAPAPQASPEATAIVTPKPEAKPPAPPPPAPPVDTGKTGPVPIVPPAPAAKRKGGGLVIGLVVGVLVFLLLAVGGVVWLAKRYLSSRVASVTQPLEAPVAEAPPVSEPPMPEAPVTEVPAEPEVVAESAPPEEPAEAPQAAPAKPAPASVMVTSDPAGARVSVGKKQRGVTPFRLTLPPGKASISVEKDGYKPWHKDLRLAAGAKETLEARLEELPREAPPPPPPTAPSVKTGDLVALTPDVTPPKKLSGESVNLPSSVRKKKPSGSVLVEFVVDENGRVRDAKIAESGGDALDGPCLDAVKTWRYEAATLKGVKVKVPQKARFTFQSR